MALSLMLKKLSLMLKGSPKWGCLAAVLLVVSLAAGWWATIQIPAGIPVVEIQLAGSMEEAGKILRSVDGVPPGRALDLARSAVHVDWLLILAYVFGFSVACWVGRHLFLSPPARTLAKGAIGATFAAGVSDALENVLLLSGLSKLKQIGVPFEVLPGAPRFDVFSAASGAAAAKFALLVFAAPMALAGFLVLVRRLVGHGLPRFRVWIRRSSGRYLCPSTPLEQDGGKVLLPWPTGLPGGDRWPEHDSAIAKELQDSPLRSRARHRYGRVVPSENKAPDVPDGRDPAQVGFCVSGGGVRSACFALGALQVLRPALLKARYVVSVSGGGYIVGAMQQALESSTGDYSSEATAEDVYEPGSMEEDHTRRHGKYLADGFGQWVKALWEVLRGLIASALVITAGVVTLGLLFAHLYSNIELVDRSGVSEVFVGEAAADLPGDAGGEVPPFPRPAGYGGWTILLLGVVAGLLWMASLYFVGAPGRDGFRIALQRAGSALLILTALMAVLILVLPSLMWVAAYATVQAEGLTAQKVGGAGGGTLLLTYLAAARLALGGGRAAGLASKVKGWFGKDKPSEGKPALPGSLAQGLMVWFVLIVLGAVNLLILAITMVMGDRWETWLQLLFPSLLLVLWIVVDETWMSLHPFYRRRIASAFAVRRVGLMGGDVAAQPYDFESEDTPLSTYGAKMDGFPQVIFSCAANLSGTARTPPGRRACSFTMSHDYIGGPDVGWVPTKVMEQAVKGPVAADLTVQAAVAVSGAAFASAMGTQSRPIEKLLAITNLRLGTWLPNPVYLDRLIRAAEEPGNEDWWLPDLPRIRRLTYFFREILGSGSMDNRLLLVTDGGHYDNLGLLELLRHRCRTIYCLDAGGDPPPFPQTLNEAITQARAELGIKITFNGGDLAAMIPGSVSSTVPAALEPLLARLASSAVAVADVEYPEPFQADGETEASNRAKLVFGKAILTADLPSELLARAQADPAFPRTSTGDQWFTYEQFNGYQGLGRHVGTRMEEAARSRGIW